MKISLNWLTDYVDESTKPLYPFGHGLSYTHFSYENLHLDKATLKSGETLTVTVTLPTRGPCVARKWCNSTPAMNMPALALRCAGCATLKR